MTQNILNYRVNNIPVNMSFLNQQIPQSINQWLPVLNNNTNKPINTIEFKLNNPFIEDIQNINNTKENIIHTTRLSGDFVSIHQVVSIILAQEKHKVVRNEITEGTYRMTKVRLLHSKRRS